MHIIYCITSLSKQGGAQKIFTHLCIELSKKPTITVEVISLLGGYFTKELQSQNIPVKIIYQGIKTPFNIFSLVLKLLQQNKKNTLVHGFLPHGAGFGALVSILINVPLIYAIRNSSLSENPKRQVSNLVKRVLHAISLKRATLITVNSKSICGQIQKQTKKKVQLIYNAVNAIPKEWCVDEVVKNKFFLQNKFTVVSVCNMRSPQKDIPALIDVAQKMPNAAFVLVGGGESLSEFKKYATQQNVSNVTFTGHVNNVYPYLYYANCYILLTRYEGFPNTVLEAMALQKPVVLSDIPELRETLIDPPCCTFVKNQNTQQIIEALLKIENNDVTIQEYNKNATVLINTLFSVQTMMNDTLLVYNECGVV